MYCRVKHDKTCHTCMPAEGKTMFVRSTDNIGLCHPVMASSCQDIIIPSGDIPTHQMTIMSSHFCFEPFLCARRG